jgi:spore maturation protein CgeB
MGTVHYEKEMPLVFRHSRINLNITLRSIQNGIPLRAMDIMGAGGFLLTNYQNDFTMHFVQGEDYVCYESQEDMMDKIDYYLKHEKERKEIAKNGQKKVCREHTYKKRLGEIFDIVNA